MGNIILCGIGSCKKINFCLEQRVLATASKILAPASMVKKKMMLLPHSMLNAYYFK